MIIWETLMFWNGQLRLHQKDSFMEKEMKAAVNLQTTSGTLGKMGEAGLRILKGKRKRKN